MIKIAIVGILAVFAAIQFKQGKQEYSILIGVVCCLLIFYYGIGKMDTVVKGIDRIKGYLSINVEYIQILLKIIGITYVSEFAAALCKDAGYAAIAGQIELAGKLSIMAISMPILLALLDTIERFFTA